MRELALDPPGRPPFAPLLCRETADNWDAEIAEDVGSECQKYGPVEHVFVDRNSRGYVYVVSGCGDAFMCAGHACKPCVCV